MKPKAEVISELRNMLADVFAAKEKGEAYGRLARAHGSPGNSLLGLPDARTDVGRKGAERMHEIAGLLRGREADGQVVAGHRGGREVGEGLEEMRGDGRAGERDQDV